MKLNIITTLLFLISTQCALASSKLSLGLSSLYTHTNNPTYSYKSDYKPNLSLNIGSFFREGNFSFGISTNRIFNKATKRKATTSNGDIDIKTQITADSFQIGYFVKRWMPTIFISNVKVKQNSNVNSEILYGVGISYFTTKNTNLSLNFVAPNQELFIEGGAVLGINLLI